MMPAVFQYFENAILQLRRIMRVQAFFLQAENSLAIVFFGQNIHRRVPGSKAGAADPLEGVTARFVHQKRTEACWMQCHRRASRDIWSPPYGFVTLSAGLPFRAFSRNHR